MSLLLNNIANDDFLWNAIASHLPNNRRSATSFANFRCPICLDYKPRCGIKRDTRIGISCFNCGFNTGYRVGDPIYKKMGEFLRGIGVNDLDLKKLTLHARAIKRAIEDSPSAEITATMNTFEPNFPKMDLPEGALTLGEWADLGCRDADYLATVEYALSRGDVLMQYGDFRWSPVEKYSRRLIIPFKWRDEIVGYTARAIEDDPNKYLNFMPSSYLFNNACLDSKRDFALVIEGPLDALAIDGVSPLGSKLNENQATWLKASGKRIIVVADRDKAGDKMVTLARQHGFAVSFPALKANSIDWWDEDIKDCDEAVKRHGRLYTLKSILESATTNATEIEVKRRYLV